MPELYRSFVHAHVHVHAQSVHNVNSIIQAKIHSVKIILDNNTDVKCSSVRDQYNVIQ